MGKLQTAAQTTTPQQDQESPTTATGELTGLQAELMRAQQLAGAGNAYVQDQLNQQAMAPMQAATAEAVAVSQSPDVEVADVEQAIEEAGVAVKGAEEGGGITTEAPPAAPGDGEATPELAAGPEVAATPASEAVADEAAAPAQDVRGQTAKEFSQVYRSTSPAETDAWLDALAAREAGEPALAGLAAELRGWVSEKRAAKAASVAPSEAKVAPVESTAATPSEAASEEGGGLWGLLVGIKDALSAALDAVLSIPRRIVEGLSGL